MKNVSNEFQDFYDQIAEANKPVVSIGGDHSITGGIVQSLAKKNSKLTKGNKVSLVHFRCSYGLL